MHKKQATGFAVIAHIPYFCYSYIQIKKYNILREIQIRMVKIADTLFLFQNAAYLSTIPSIVKTQQKS